MRAFWLLALASCVSAPTPAVTLARPPGRAVTLPLPAARPCVVEAERFTRQSPLRLLTRSGEAFAEVRFADHVALAIEMKSPLEVTTRGVRLVGPARPDLLPLRARTAHVFRGILAPGGDTPLAWAAAGGGAIAIAPEPDARIAWADGPPFETVACDDVAMESSLDASDDPSAADQVALRAGDTPIAATPGAAPVAVLRGALDVLVTERRGADAHIVWNVSGGALDGARVFGWIDAAAIASPHVGSMLAHGRTVAGMEATSDWTGCDADHPLFVEIGGRVERVGEVLAGTRVRSARPAERGLVRIDLNGPETRADPPEVALLPGASFAMSAADAERCR